MTYASFIKECGKSEAGMVIYALWLEQKLPLTWAMKLSLRASKHKGTTEEFFRNPKNFENL